MSDFAMVKARGKEMAAFVEGLHGISVLDVRRVGLLARRTIAENPDLATCTTSSLRRAFAACALTGLYPDGKEAAIVPFNNRKSGKKEAVFIPGYHGLVRLAWEHPDVTGLNFGVVYAGEVFEVVEGTEPSLRYCPAFDGSVERIDANIVAAWAWLEVKGRRLFYAMNRAEIDAIRSRAPGKDGDAWRKSYGAMAQKTALKQLLGKRAPQIRQLALAIAADDAAEAGIPQTLDAVAEEVIENTPEVAPPKEPWEKKPAAPESAPTAPGTERLADGTVIPAPDDFPFPGPTPTKKGGPA